MNIVLIIILILAVLLVAIMELTTVFGAYKHTDWGKPTLNKKRGSHNENKKS